MVCGTPSPRISGQDRPRRRTWWAPRRQAPGHDADRSRALGAARRPRARLAPGPARRPARHPAALASRRALRILAVEVATGAGAPAAPGGDRGPDPADGG